MHPINKYISFIVFTTFLSVNLASCRKINIDGPSHEEQYPMGYVVSEVQAKASDKNNITTDNISSEGSAFKVFAYYTTDGKKYEASDDAFDSFNDIVRFDEGSATNWSSDQTHYWYVGAYYKFRAYYPAEFPATITDSKASTPSFSGFTIEPLPQNQTDILFAEVQKATEDTFLQGLTVPFQFKHLLSKVYLKVRMSQELVDDGFTADILAAGFRDVTRTAGYTKDRWTAHSGKTDVGMNFSSVKELPDEDNLLDMFDNGILVIPQEVTAGVVRAYIHVELPIGNSGNKIERPIEITLPASSPAWEPGKIYIYTATITADYNIEFSTPTVANWEGGSTSGAVVIR